MHKFYYTYKITLLKGSLAGHYYYGKHKTNNLNDGYAGSGRIVRNYYKKYDKIEGITYVKSILQFYNSDEELYAAEKILIGDKYKTDELCLNLSEGGKGPIGFNHSDNAKNKIRDSKIGHIIDDDTRNKISLTLKGQTSPFKGKHHSISSIEKLKKANLGKHHSEETKQKMSKAKQGLKWKKDPDTGKRIYYKNIA